MKYNTKSHFLWVFFFTITCQRYNLHKLFFDYRVEMFFFLEITGMKIAALRWYLRPNRCVKYDKLQASIYNLQFIQSN